MPDVTMFLTQMTLAFSASPAGRNPCFSSEKTSPAKPKRRRKSAYYATLAEKLHDADDRQKQRDHDGADDQGQKQDQQRLDQGAQPGHRRVDLFLVNVGDFVEHRIQLAGLLPHFDHAAHQWGKYTTVLQWPNHGSPFLDAVVDAENRRAHAPIATGIARDEQRPEDRHAAAKECAERSREARDHRPERETAEDR